MKAALTAIEVEANLSSERGEIAAFAMSEQVGLAIVGWPVPGNSSTPGTGIVKHSPKKRTYLIRIENQASGSVALILLRGRTK